MKKQIKTTQLIIKLTHLQATEIGRKFEILAHESLASDGSFAGITPDEAGTIYQSLPTDDAGRAGGNWTVPAIGRTAMVDELRDCALMHRDAFGRDCAENGERGQALQAYKMARKLDSIANQIAAAKGGAK